MSTLDKRFFEHWNKHFKPFAQAPFLLAVSGGLDSMVLLDLMRRLGVPLFVAHVNYNLRGTESIRDQKIVENYCQQYQIPFEALCLQPNELGKEGQSIQAPARSKRYEWFQELLKNHALQSIVTAHHADDNAETILAHILKGCGLAGSKGILPINGCILRPLLVFTKAELLAYAVSKQLSYGEDSSNVSTKYERNFIRLEVLPTLTERFPNAVQGLNQTAQVHADAAHLLAALSQEWIQKNVKCHQEDQRVAIRLLLKLKAYKTLLWHWLEPYGFTSAQLEDVCQLLHSASGHFVSSSTHWIIKDRHHLILSSLQNSLANLIPIQLRKRSDKIDLGNGDYLQINYGAYAYHHIQERCQANCFYIDAEHAEEAPLLLRHWQDGDYFYPLGMGMKKKKVSKYFKDEKVNLIDKERIWLLTQQERVLWLVGHRLDERTLIKNPQYKSYGYFIKYKSTH